MYVGKEDNNKKKERKKKWIKEKIHKQINKKRGKFKTRK
jgi:hypothetical protein